MSFENRVMSDLIKILAAGGGLTLDASNRVTSDLIRLAAAAASGNAQLCLTSISDRVMSDLVRIAAAGKGRVTFA